MEKEVLDVGEGLARGVGYSYVLTSVGADSCTYEWRLGNFFDSQAPYMETEDFVAGQYKWRLRLFPKATHLEVDYITINLVSLNPADVTANVGVAAVNYRNQQNSRSAGATFTFKPNEEHGFPCFQDHCSIGNPNSGFFYQGSYVIKVSIAVVPTEADREAPLQRTPVPPRETRTIHVSILTDKLFEQKLDKMHPFGLLDLPDGADWAVQASMELSRFTAQV